MELASREVRIVADDVLPLTHGSYPPVWSVNGDRIYYTNNSNSQEITLAKSNPIGPPETNRLVGTSHLTINSYLGGTIQDNHQMLLIVSFNESEDIYCAKLDSARAGDVYLKIPPNLAVNWNNRAICLSPYSSAVNSSIVIQTPPPGLNKLELYSGNNRVFEGLVPAAGSQRHPYMVGLSPEAIMWKNLRPKSLLKTVVFPGWGQLDQDRRGVGFLFGTGFAALLGSALAADYISNDHYSDYQSATDPKEAYSSRMEYQRYERGRDMLFSTAAVYWGLSLIDYVWGHPKKVPQVLPSEELVQVVNGDYARYEPLSEYSSCDTELAFLTTKPCIDVYMRPSQSTVKEWKYIGTTGVQYSVNGGLVLRHLQPGEYDIRYAYHENGQSYPGSKTVLLQRGMRTSLPLNPRSLSAESWARKSRRFVPGLYQYMDCDEKFKGGAMFFAEAILLTLTVSSYSLWGDQLNSYNTSTERSDIVALKNEYKRGQAMTYTFGISAAVLYAYHLWDVFTDRDARVDPIQSTPLEIEWLPASDNNNR